QRDSAGTGIYDLTRSDVVALNADGSSTETVSDYNANGSLRTRTVTTTSADGLSVSSTRDIDGNGTVDQSEVTTVNADGSRVDTISDYSANGSLKDRSVATVSASGRSTVIERDATGDGVFEFVEHGDVVVAADGTTRDTITHLNGDGSLH